MKLEVFKEEKKKQKSIMIFTITCILLIIGVFLYQSFASFQVVKNEDYINGSIDDPGDIYFAFYKDNIIQKDMPKRSDGYVLDEKKSYCGVTGGNDSNIKVSITEDETIHVNGAKTSRTKCNLYFVKGVYILGKGIPLAPEGEDGLYEVKHDDVSGTLNDEGFRKTEYRYAGKNPNNYIRFNNEEWRIIGLVNVMTDENNTVEQRVKIVRNDAFSGVSYNSTQSLSWETSNIMKLLNEGDYYTRNGAYASNGLLDVSKSMIEKVYWNLGAPNYAYDKDILSRYIQERWNKSAKICQTVDCATWNNEYTNDKTTWNGLIALKYSTDYLYATGGSNREECFNSALQGAPGQKCTDFNWIINKQDISNSENLLSPMIKIESTAFVSQIRFDGYVTQAHASVTYEKSTFKPTLYLKTNVKIVANENDGSSIYPYEIMQIIKN